MNTLVLAGAEIGRTAHVRVGAAFHYPNLYGVSVGPSGAAGRKGTARTEIRGVFARRVRVVGGVASGEGIIWNVRDPIPKRGKNGEHDPGVTDKRLVVREAEFSQVLRVASRDANTTSIVLREAWDGGDRLQTLAKNNPATATGAHVSMLADITPDELRRELTVTDRQTGSRTGSCGAAHAAQRNCPTVANRTRRSSRGRTTVCARSWPALICWAASSATTRPRRCGARPIPGSLAGAPGCWAPCSRGLRRRW